MPYFYHYTDDAGAQSIIRSGRILTSVGFMSGDDAGYGNGVYVTKLSPQTSSKSQIALNNWRSSSANFIKRTENYFVIDIPESEIKNTEAAGRNIYVFGRRNDLLLYKYPWWLKNFDSGEIIASYKYHMASFGPVSIPSGVPNYDHSKLLGDYRMVEDNANGRPVFKLENDQADQHKNAFLFISSNGEFWYVGPNTGEDKGWLKQTSNHGFVPDSNSPWKYSSLIDGQARWKDDDSTLKCHAWQV